MRDNRLRISLNGDRVGLGEGEEKKMGEGGRSSSSNKKLKSQEIWRDHISEEMRAEAGSEMATSGTTVSGKNEKTFRARNLEKKQNYSRSFAPFTFAF